MSYSIFTLFANTNLRYLNCSACRSNLPQNQREQSIIFRQRIIASDLGMVISSQLLHTRLHIAHVHAEDHRLMKPTQPHHLQKQRCKSEVSYLDTTLIPAALWEPVHEYYKQDLGEQANLVASHSQLKYVSLSAMNLNTAPTVVI